MNYNTKQITLLDGIGDKESLQEFHLLAGKLEQQCKDVEAGEDSQGGGKGGEGGGGEGGGGGGGWRGLLEKTRREMLEAAGLALQVEHFDSS